MVADAEGGPPVSISRNAAQVNEGTDVVFTLTRTGVTTDPLRVLVGLGGHTKVGTAETVARLGTVETADFAAGVSSIEVRLTTEDDALNEGDGELYAEIKPSLIYRIEGDARQAIIVKDDDIPVLTVGESEKRTIVEGTPMVWTVHSHGRYEH